jgi:hypothetical protein
MLGGRSMTTEFLRKHRVEATVAGTILVALTAGLFVYGVGRGNAPEFISAVAQLLWPITFLTVVYWFRDEIRSVLIRMRKGKFAGSEIELESGVKEPPPQSLQTPRQRTAMEYKILRTLWSKQVNRFPRYEGVWTFRINQVSPDFFEYREAANKLMGEGLVGETDQGQIYLTPSGFAYCKKSYTQFPLDEFFPHERLLDEKLKEALTPY